MKTRLIWTKIWEDSFFEKLNKAEKLLFIYYITNPNINCSGAYEITDRKVRFDTSCSEDELSEFKTKVFEAKKIIFSGDYVFVVNADSNKYQNYVGEKNELCKIKEIDKIPSDSKDEFNHLTSNTLSIRYQCCIDSTRNKKQENLNQHLKDEKEKTKLINKEEESKKQQPAIESDKSKNINNSGNSYYEKKRYVYDLGGEPLDLSDIK